MAKKVLVVDDEKLIVKGIRFSLEQDGMEVTCAYDGEEALHLAQENKFDMILLDIMLPKMDGFEVCQAIRLLKLVKEVFFFIFVPCLRIYVVVQCQIAEKIMDKDILNFLG
mgnify:CR=1 FL=1